ncbi:PREDICTED: biogenesis of lysosome-related organelles complex 1 subunit 5-like isoform X2 [Amphimedon queenslandica]|nr:PREDICTED: biogenesis of lysosome-related organelles complex 1 subunit 5-like isoform X1 [Amphimedon queenslandica]XP_019850542.1 PREDICTED: biogenesis of lysosome-related organelles complex 1 subunit 5-like isoform X2 [Amphimedon queenslandica]|eukprot:XP_019850541.1 PREDICTED: biogenesis of lysosome-related organelles complex 1 subunit 5-like isoform X1 [Amphimedon queenslandica]
MATDAIISDAGSIYKRLLNHRPVLQNEVHYFVQEFESKRGDSDVKLLKDTMKLANEIDAVYLEEMKQSIPLFNQIKSNLSDVVAKCDGVLQKKNDALELSSEEKEAMKQEVEELKSKLAEEKRVFDEEMDNKMSTLKAEADVHREQRNRLRQTRPAPRQTTPPTPS